MVEYLGLKMIFIVIIILLVIWSLVWTAIGMWKASRNNQIVWFIFIFLLNTIGILPIVYILFFQKDLNENSKTKLKNKK